MNTPDTLNGYPVVKFQQHANCATVMCIRDAGNALNAKSYVVATWWPKLGDSWAWGHYVHDTDPADAEAAAQGHFNDVAARNAKR